MDNFNSAFLYGSSVFTTAKVKRGEIVDWRIHLKRLLAGVKSYYFVDSAERLAEALRKVSVPDDFTGALRVTVFVKNSKSMDQEISENDLDFTVNLRKISSFIKEPIVLKLTKRVQSNELDLLKIGSYGKEIYLRKNAKLLGADDVLFYGEGLIYETTTANIFLRKADRIFTPKSGIYKGLTREKLIENSGVIQKDIRVDEIDEYDEIFTASSLFDKVVVKEIIDEK